MFILLNVKKNAVNQCIEETKRHFNKCFREHRRSILDYNGHFTNFTPSLNISTKLS